MSNETENHEPENTVDETVAAAAETVIAEGDTAVVEDAPVVEDADVPGNESARPLAAGDDLPDDEGDDGIVEVEDDPAPVVLAGRPADAAQLQRIVEGALMAAGKPLAVSDIGELFEAEHRPAPDEIRAALAAIGELCAGRGFELREVASGFRFQVVQEVAPWVGRLWEEKPQRYSRALLETLALIAYRQPITRGDIEDIRGVAVASNIVKTLLERDWVRVVGHKDVPGRPAMYATTRRFLDYFNLKNLDDLPPLAELRDLDTLNAELALEGVDTVMEENVAVENNVVAINAHQAEAAEDSAESPAGDESSGGQSAVTLASLAAGFADRGEGEPDVSGDEPADAETAEGAAGANDFASIVAALRARDQSGGASDQIAEMVSAVDAADRDVPDVDSAGEAATAAEAEDETDGAGEETSGSEADDASAPKRDQ